MCFKTNTCSRKAGVMIEESVQFSMKLWHNSCIFLHWFTNKSSNSWVHLSPTTEYPSTQLEHITKSNTAQQKKIPINATLHKRVTVYTDRWILIVYFAPPPPPTVTFVILSSRSLAFFHEKWECLVTTKAKTQYPLFRYRSVSTFRSSR